MLVPTCQSNIGILIVSYFPDLSIHTYTAREPEAGVINIGWLGKGNQFALGNTPPAFAAALKELCAHPVKPHRGFHVCEYCKNNSGNGQIRVRNDEGVWFAAPTMIYHYVTEHQYRPPDQFVDCVLNPKHIADSKTERDQETWRDDLLDVFPDWETKELEAQLSIAQEVKGIVVARAPFGVWLDIGVEVPALLLVVEMWQAAHGQVVFTDYAPKGTLVRAQVISIIGSKIRLTQNSTFQS